MAAKLGNTRLLSRKSVELMTHDQLGKIGSDQAFGIGFGINGVKTPLAELGSPGEYNWGGFFYTAFSIDPKEQMIGSSWRSCIPPASLRLDRRSATCWPIRPSSTDVKRYEYQCDTENYLFCYFAL